MGLPVPLEVMALHLEAHPAVDTSVGSSWMRFRTRGRLDLRPPGPVTCVPGCTVQSFALQRQWGKALWEENRGLISCCPAVPSSCHCSLLSALVSCSGRTRHRLAYSLSLSTFHRSQLPHGISAWLPTPSQVAIRRLFISKVEALHHGILSAFLSSLIHLSISSDFKSTEKKQAKRFSFFPAT